MKKFAIAMLMISGSGLAHADYQVVSANGSALSQLCVAAATSSTNMQGAAEAAGITPAGLDTVRCNGLTLARFAARYGSESPGTAPVVAYLLKGTDDSDATALCLAAASSEQEFMKVKSMYFGTASAIEAEVRCNGLPLKTFARKYGKPALAISQR